MCFWRDISLLGRLFACCLGDARSRRSVRLLLETVLGANGAQGQCFEQCGRRNQLNGVLLYAVRIAHHTGAQRSVRGLQQTWLKPSHSNEVVDQHPKFSALDAYHQQLWLMRSAPRRAKRVPIHDESALPVRSACPKCNGRPPNACNAIIWTYFDWLCLMASLRQHARSPGVLHLRKPARPWEALLQLAACRDLAMEAAPAV
jgi:hypothetical protein